MAICKICGKDGLVTCLCGYCMFCIKRLGHQECYKIAKVHKNLTLLDSSKSEVKEC